MIDKAVFVEEWKALLVRFGRKVDDANTEQGRRFYAFLSPLMDTETFTSAARSVWATSRFFPRPADFLTTQATEVWAEMSALLRAYNPPIWGERYSATEWWQAWRALPDAATDAADALGTAEQLQKLLHSHSMKLREQWERLYEQHTVTEAVKALPPAKGAALLTAGVP